MQTLNTKFNTNNIIYNLRSVFIYYLKPSKCIYLLFKTFKMNNLTIRKL